MNETIARIIELMEILENIATARRSGEITAEDERELVDALLTQ